MVGDLRKAEDADRYVLTRQTIVEFPDYWILDAASGETRRITDANPQQAEYAWTPGRVLIDYTDSRGHDLQATLTLPAGYEEGRRYPMLVYFYEKMSQRHHEYSQPVYDDRPHMSTYASNGYLVLMPDIIYDDGRPGTSALDDVTSAVQRVIDLGYADPDHVGLQGHSWGGYESSFIVTQTDMFAAVVTGAPLTNLESMHNILYKQSGGGNAPLIQWGQGRMGTVPWEDPEGYASQSPVRFVKNITTPFMILHGTADGAVDWNQGLEFYVAARREGKNVILLSYQDEPHHLAQKDNQKDFQIRMKQYFDHYLKGAPAPAWMTEGVPYLERDREDRGGNSDSAGGSASSASSASSANGGRTRGSRN
jgi:dipeptidyl aminopeptidase/acylaminoacyl peptidase